MQISLPNTAAGSLKWIGVLAAVVLLAVVGIYAVNALLAMGVTLLVIAVVAAVAWVVLGRLSDWLRHGKPLLRRGGGGDGA